MEKKNPNAAAELPIWSVNLQRILEQRGLQQSAVADAAKLSKDAFGRYFNGRTKPPAGKLIAIAHVLKVKPSDIDPSCAQLDCAEVPNEQRVPNYKLTPPTSGRAGRIRLELDLELPPEVAMKIISEIEKASQQD